MNPNCEFFRKMPNPTQNLFVLQDFVDYQLSYFKERNEEHPEKDVPTRERLVQFRKQTVYNTAREKRKAAASLPPPDNNEEVKQLCRNQMCLRLDLQCLC